MDLSICIIHYEDRLGCLCVKIDLYCEKAGIKTSQLGGEVP
jgi:hypothetical protein